KLRTDALARLAEAMAPEALRFFAVEEHLAAAVGIAGAGESGLGQLFVLGPAALAPKVQVKLRSRLGRSDLDQQSVDALDERRGKAVGVDLEAAGLGALMKQGAVDPDTEAAMTRREKLDCRRLSDGHVGK